LSALSAAALTVTYLPHVPVVGVLQKLLTQPWSSAIYVADENPEL
jgi:hypothetical protein